MLKIPLEVQSVLSATSHIHNFKRVVEELVYNSLDAKSTSIAIRINIQDNFVQVVDNGCGISRSSFDLLGQKYSTSKLVDMSSLKSIPHTYGFRGLSLSNIIELSVELKIVSKIKESNETWLKVFSQGLVEKVTETATRASKGTTVEIIGFLYNLKIQRNSINSLNEMFNIKGFLEKLSLIHLNVSFSLRDDTRNEIVFQIHKNRDLFKTISNLFNFNSKDIQELHVEKNEYKIVAHIGKNNYETMKYQRQWVFLNGRFISKTKIHNILHEKFDKSLGFQLSRGPKKKINKNSDELYIPTIPIYFLFITCPYFDYDLNMESKTPLLEFKCWDNISNLLEKLVQFYFGHIVLKETTKQNAYSNNKHAGTNESTRDDVKKIIEKFLGNGNRPNGLFIQNGVKGKNAKRKSKKNIKDFASSSKEAKIYKDPFQKPFNTRIGHLNKVQLKSIKPINIINLNNEDKYIHGKKEYVFSSKKNESLEIISKDNNLNMTKDLKESIIQDPFISKFLNPSESLKIRCELIDCNRNLNQDEIKENMNVSLINTEVKSSNSKNQKYYGYNEDIVPRNCNAKNNGNHLLIQKVSSNVNNIISSYDLVQTILGTQNERRTSKFQNIVKENMLMGYSNAPHSNYYVNKHNCTNNNVYSSLLTYESHKYNSGQKANFYTNMNNRKFHFISKNSRQNFSVKRQVFRNKLKNKERRSDFLHNIFKNANCVNSNGHIGLMKSNFTIDTPDSPQSNIKIDGFDIVNTDNIDENIIKKSVNNATYTINDITITTYGTCEEKIAHENTNSLYRHSFEHELGRDISAKYDITYSMQFTKKSIVSIENPSKTEVVTLNSLSCSLPGNANNDNVNIHTNVAFENLGLISASQQSSEVLHPINLCETTFGTNNLSNHIEKSSLPLENSNVVYEKLDAMGSKNSLMNNDNHNKSPSISKGYEIFSENKETNAILLQDSFSVNKIDRIDVTDVHNGNEIINNNFNFKSRHPFIPKGMSPIFVNHISKCEFKDSHIHKEFYNNQIYENFVDNVKTNVEIFEPRFDNDGDQKKYETKVNKNNSHLIFNAESLKQAKVLGQIDSKFVAAVLCGKISNTCTNSDFLVLFDQHAVDERVRLEKNLTDYLDDNVWKSVNIDVISFKLSQDDMVFLHNNNDKLSKFGLQWKVVDNKIFVYGIPVAILGKIPRQVDVIIKASKNLLLEQIDCLKYAKGNIPLYPKSIMELVFNEACRYAIKFGDKLSKNNCINLINSLATCKTPFQCAHGRPVMAVMLDLMEEQRAYSYQVNLDKVSSWKKLYM